MSGKLKILVVEDEEAISNFIATTLKANDYNVIIARSGNEALSMLPSHCPDVALLDLGLPDIDGLDVLKKIREWSNVPVVVVSARTEEATKSQHWIWGLMIILQSLLVHLNCWQEFVLHCVMRQKAEMEIFPMMCSVYQI